MLIGNNLIRSSVARFAAISAFNQNIGFGTTWTSAAITLEQAEHAFLWKAWFTTVGDPNQGYINVRINGASVFDPYLSFFPSGVVVGTHTTEAWENMYFPPNSVIDLTITNTAGMDAIRAWGHFVIYRFYDTDLAKGYESPDCPLWLKEPPAWLVKALGY